MANIEEVKALVEEYQFKYRHPTLERFAFLDKYYLKTDNPVCTPLAEKNGVYVILKENSIIYIGKSSSRNKGIWHRIYDHIYSSRRSSWSHEATHYIAWAVPDDSFFEASALEEFLIFRLKDQLPVNKVGM